MSTAGHRIPPERRGLPIIATLSRQVGNHSRVVTNTERMLARAKCHDERARRGGLTVPR